MFESGLRTFAPSHHRNINLHQLTDVDTATAAAIPRFDNVCTHTKPLKGYKAEIV